MTDRVEELGLSSEALRECNFALNSRRLTGEIVNRIAAELGVPTGGALEDTRRMVEGALSDAGREPHNVRVCVLETDEGVAVRLEDENGIFTLLAPDPGEETSPTYRGEGSEGAGKREDHVEETEAET